MSSASDIRDHGMEETMEAKHRRDAKRPEEPSFLPKRFSAGRDEKDMLPPLPLSDSQKSKKKKNYDWLVVRTIVKIH